MRDFVWCQAKLEFLVSLDVAFHRRSSERAVSDCESLKELEFGGLQAAAARAGGPVWRAGPDLRRGSGNRRKASKFRKHAASASLTRVRVAAGRQPPRRIRACGSALAVSRTSRVRAIWTRWSQRSRVVRPRCHMAPRPSTILRSRNRGSMLHLLE